MGKKVQRKRNAKGHFLKVKDNDNLELELERFTVADPRLDRLMPVLVKVITQLLSSAGMMRYRTDFIVSIREIMLKEADKKD